MKTSAAQIAALSEEVAKLRRGLVRCWAVEPASGIGRVLCACGITYADALDAYNLYQSPGQPEIPALGCGCGGLDWRDVKSLIASAAEQMHVDHVVICPPMGTAP